MSWFTADAKTSQPPCERCKSPDFVALVKRGEKFYIFDCRKCGAIEPKRGAQ
jgi:translation initiation factor 2 beta subunit (eIF-2beta)/eIF-5